MICAYCGKNFDGRKRKYCTKTCCLLAHGHNPDYKPEPFCLVCGKPLSEGQKKYCSGACRSKAYHRRKGGISLTEYKQKHKALLSRKEKEKQQRESLTDRIIKRHIYITLNRKEKGSVKYKQITSAMITETRAQILAWRDRKAKPKEIIKKVWYCKVCGKKLDSYGVYCGEECIKAFTRNKYHENRDAILKNIRDNYKPKPKTEKICKQCDGVFMGFDGNRYCSDVCRRIVKHDRKDKRRAEKMGVYYEPVNALRVFERDGWQCQLCMKKLKPKHRGTIRDDAPELDHIIPWAQGGEHSYRNTQCACRKCNSKKRDIERGQLRLFG